MGKNWIFGAASTALTTAAVAAVSFDPAPSTGFVGKGDVQQALGWNNKQLQDNASSVVFYHATVTDRNWYCTDTKNETVHKHERTTTVTGVASAVTRDKNQITGFTLSGPAAPLRSTTEGPS